MTVLPPNHGQDQGLKVRPDAVRDGGPTGERSDDSVAAIRYAALVCFAERGYDGTTMRQIAAKADMSLSGIYHHFPAKIDMLYAIVRDSVLTMVGQTEEALKGCDDGPVAQLRAITAAHVDYHVNHQLEAFVGAYELRSFSGDHLVEIARLRRRQQDMFDQTVHAIAEAGYPVLYQDEISRAIVSMGMEVARWYRPDGPLTKEEVIKRYAAIALVLAGVPQNEISSNQ